MTDPIADMITRLRNALAVGHYQIKVPYSQIKESIAGILKTHRFIKDFKVEQGPFKELVIEITDQGQSPKLTSLKRLSKPGRRLYAGSRDIPSVLGGRGIVIVSTSTGLMTGQEARRKHLGGELICEIY